MVGSAMQTSQGMIFDDFVFMHTISKILKRNEISFENNDFITMLCC